LWPQRWFYSSSEVLGGRSLAIIDAYRCVVAISRALLGIASDLSNSAAFPKVDPSSSA